MNAIRLIACIGLVGLVLPVVTIAQQVPDDGSSEVASPEIVFITAEAIETDRDSFTPAATVAAWGRLIAELSYTSVDNDLPPATHSVPELLLRYGVNDWLEFRLGWNDERGAAGNPAAGAFPSNFTATGGFRNEARIAYGFKAWLTEQDGWQPHTALIVQGLTPTSGDLSATEVMVTLVARRVLNNGWIWDSALRYSTGRVYFVDESEEGSFVDAYGIWSPSTVLKIPLNDRWSVHAEYFGIFSSNRPDAVVQHYFSPGVHYLITSDLELGVRFGCGLNGDAANFFTNVGLGWQY